MRPGISGCALHILPADWYGHNFTGNVIQNYFCSTKWSKVLGLQPVQSRILFKTFKPVKVPNFRVYLTKKDENKNSALIG